MFRLRIQGQLFVVHFFRYANLRQVFILKLISRKLTVWRCSGINDYSFTPFESNERKRGDSVDELPPSLDGGLLGLPSLFYST